jgi:NAD(P)H-dependent FMN reductase
MRAILISSPEYAHGVPGVVKTLDWVVGIGELIGKPIADQCQPPFMRGCR